MPDIKLHAVPQADDAALLALGRDVLRTEAEAISALAARLDTPFVNAVRLILASAGRVIVTGVGKSGHIARKIAATLASTGTPAYFVHAAEASHGDLGMIADHDVVLALSNSGSSAEILAIAPTLKRLGVRLIAMTGNAQSPLAQLADVHLDASVDKEACPLNLAPTASTTAALALGDALALALLDAHGFGREDFARSHPGGMLGRRLLTHVADVMRRGDRVPQVKESASFSEALLEVSRGGMGMTAVLREDGRVAGIFTDGDLRRLLAAGHDLRQLSVAEVMHRTPRHIRADALAAEAAALMEEFHINQLLVLDENACLIGALNTHDLMDAKVI